MIRRLLFCEFPVPIKDLNLYELEHATGELHVWEAEPMKTIGVLELSTKQILATTGPDSPNIGTPECLLSRVEGLRVPGFVHDEALNQRDNTFGTNSCEVLIDLPADEVLITRVKNRV